MQTKVVPDTFKEVGNPERQGIKIETPRVEPPKTDEGKKESDTQVERFVDILKEKLGNKTETKEVEKVFDPDHVMVDYAFTVKQFQDDGMPERYKEAGIEGRIQILEELNSKFSEINKIDIPLYFEEMPEGRLGGFIPKQNCIVLNSNFLESDNCKTAIDTLIHENRHIYQYQCTRYPDLVNGDPILIHTWTENLKSKNYITPELDLCRYYMQPIEMDAVAFSTAVMHEWDA